MKNKTIGFINNHPRIVITIIICIILFLFSFALYVNKFDNIPQIFVYFLLILFYSLFYIYSFINPYCPDCKVKTKILFIEPDSEEEYDRVEYKCVKCNKEVNKTFKSLFKPEERTFIL